MYKPLQWGTSSGTEMDGARSCDAAKRAKIKNEGLRMTSKEPQNAPSMYKYNKKPVISDWFLWS